MEIYGVYDKKAARYTAPFFVMSSVDAMRHFERMGMDPQTTINVWPQDFDLYYYGNFNDQSGQINPLTKPEFIINQKELQNERKKHSEPN